MSSACNSHQMMLLLVCLLFALGTQFQLGEAYRTPLSSTRSMLSSLHTGGSSNGKFRSHISTNTALSAHEDLVESTTTSLSTWLNTLPVAASDLTTKADFIPGYSNLSLYFTLFLYVLTLPGLFSLVTRSVKTKPVQKYYDIPGPANPTAKQLRLVAAEIMAYFKALNYDVGAAEETITFKGVMGKSNSQAAFLTFCTFMGLGSLGLVLSVIFPDLGAKAYLITMLSPYAGIYYWKNANRVDEVTIKMETSDDEQTTTIVARGGKEDLERFSTTLKLAERGKVYVKGLFEGNESEEVAST